MFIKKIAYMLVPMSFLFFNGSSQHPVTKPGVVKPPVTAASKEQNWKMRLSYLAGKSSWNLQSKISLRVKDENLIFGLNWQQKPANYYVMQVSNPLTGALVAQLTRDASGVALLSDNGFMYRDAR